MRLILSLADATSQPVDGGIREDAEGVWQPEYRPRQLPAAALNHRHDGPNRSLRLIELDVMPALVGKQLLAFG